MRILTWLFSAIVLMSSAVSNAGVLLSVGTNYSTTSTRDSNTNPETPYDNNETDIDYRLGFDMPGGIYIGGIYTTENGASDDNGTKGEHKAVRMGPSLGYLFKDVYIMGHYFLTSEETVKSGTITKEYSSGSGYQIDLGVKFNFFGVIGIGPQVSYKNLKYTKRKYDPGSIEGTKDYTRVEVQPEICIWAGF